MEGSNETFPKKERGRGGLVGELMQLEYEELETGFKGFVEVFSRNLSNFLHLNLLCTRLSRLSLYSILEQLNS